MPELDPPSRLQRLWPTVAAAKVTSAQVPLRDQQIPRCKTFSKRRGSPRLARYGRDALLPVSSLVSPVSARDMLVLKCSYALDLGSGPLVQDYAPSDQSALAFRRAKIGSRVRRAR